MEWVNRIMVFVFDEEEVEENGLLAIKGVARIEHEDGYLLAWIRFGQDEHAEEIGNSCWDYEVEIPGMQPHCKAREYLSSLVLREFKEVCNARGMNVAGVLKVKLDGFRNLFTTFVRPKHYSELIGQEIKIKF